jgi:glycosyltransferase involved in cell wall biosynthesis
MSYREQGWRRPDVRVLFLTTETGGFGGVQYAGRLLVRAVRDYFGPTAELAVLSLADAADSLRRLDPDCQPFAAGGRLRAVWQASRLSRIRWDLIILAHVNLAPLALFFPSAPVLALVYGIEGWRPIRGFARLSLQRAARIFYISQHTRALAESANPWLQRVPAFVCHLGLLPGLQGSEQEATTLPPADPFALCVGRMSSRERYKGHEELIRAWPRVREDRAGLRLVFLGDGDDRARLQALAARHSDGIEFLGAADDRTRDGFLARCRCFCLPARGEGLGLVYLEAMRLAKPVLAGNSDAGREVVVDGVTGRTVDSRDEAQLLRGILDVSGPRSEEMGAAGRKRFEESFDYPAFLERFSRHMDTTLSPTGVALVPQGAPFR